MYARAQNIKLAQPGGELQEQQVSARIDLTIT